MEVNKWLEEKSLEEIEEELKSLNIEDLADIRSYLARHVATLDAKLQELEAVKTPFVRQKRFAQKVLSSIREVGRGRSGKASKKAEIADLYFRDFEDI